MFFCFFFFSVDKCAKCDPHARCLNGHCKCRTGWYGNGYECIKGLLATYSGNGAKRRYRFSLPSVCGEAGRKVEVHHEKLLLF